MPWRKRISSKKNTLHLSDSDSEEYENSSHGLLDVPNTASGSNDLHNRQDSQDYQINPVSNEVPRYFIPLVQNIGIPRQAPDPTPNWPTKKKQKKTQPNPLFRAPRGAKMTANANRARST
jgi:hypothetical protein